MIKRQLSEKLAEASKKYPVLTITGPRQSGKTTLARYLFNDYQYVSLEEPDNTLMAKEDPRGFLEQFTGNLIIDEAQKAPKLFSYIQTIVDTVDKPGRFILTGSHNFLLMENITQSLAGRCAIFHLLPFSKAELIGSEPIDIDFLDNLKAPTEKNKAADLYEMLFTGFYPRIHDRKLEPQEWLQDYLLSYIERDVRLISNIGDVETFQRFMGLCAARSGQILNISSLASDCGITSTTAKKWLSILQCSFIIKLLRPHYRNFNKRLIKSPKIYFTDTGLLCHLLKIRSSDELRKSDMRGPVFETWVIDEFIKNYYNRRREPDMFFWRDSSAHEIDLLISKGSELLPIGIKSSQTFNNNLIKELNFWRCLTNNPKHPGVLIYGGDKLLNFKGLTILPWTLL
ncbi:MAG: ATP-binding protein [Sedimentisphaerales bacterium]|nr:ATP-binding protein [Sedimentisphaerales bacterium]